MKVNEEQKKSLVKVILANEANVFDAKDLVNKSVSELKAIAALAATKKVENIATEFDFSGLGEVKSVNNEIKETALVMPKVE